MTGSVLTRPGPLRALMRTAAAMIVVGLTTAMIGPFGGEQLEVNVWDKAMHFMAFAAILGAFAIWAPAAPPVMLAVAAVAYGGAIELVQGRVGRDASWGDLLADTLGVAAALAIWLVWQRLRRAQLTA